MPCADTKCETVMSTQNLITQRLLALSKLRGVGPSTLEKLLLASDFATCTIDDLAALSSKLRKALEEPSAWSRALQAADSDFDQASKSQARILCPLDVEYPDLLRATPDKPFFLYVKGKLHAELEQTIAIIGTRHPTEHGKIVCERLTTFFATRGWTIVSGLALGLDAVAHSSALTTHGHTVAVLAHGLQTIAPKQHDRLARQIIDAGGALVTEYGFGVEPLPHQFAKRDRIQAGLSKAVVMVQSDEGGGSLHASRAALDYGRYLVVPFPTARDVDMKNPKIGANLVLASDDDNARTELLRCKPQDLRRVMILKGRDDYPRLIDQLRSNRSTTDTTAQGSLLS